MATFYKTVRKHIFLHPVDKKRRHAAVKSTLLQDKQKYSDRLEGALLDVGNLKVVGDRHLIVDGYLSMEVVADFQVFSPKPGQELEGVINKRSKSHLGCLVMDTFNAALAIPSSSDLDPQIGDTCTFIVTEVVVDGEILFMRGTVTNVTPSLNPVNSLLSEGMADVDKKDSGEFAAGTAGLDDDTTRINFSGNSSAGEGAFSVGRSPDKHRGDRNLTRPTNSESSSGSTLFMEDSLNADPSPGKRKKTDRVKTHHSVTDQSTDVISPSKRRRHDETRTSDIGSAELGIIKESSVVTSPSKRSGKHRETETGDGQNVDALDKLLLVGMSPASSSRGSKQKTDKTNSSKRKETCNVRIIDGGEDAEAVSELPGVGMSPSKRRNSKQKTEITTPSDSNSVSVTEKSLDSSSSPSKKKRKSSDQSSLNSMKTS